MKAGDISSKNIAYDIARDYYLSAKNIADESMWESNYETMLKIHNSLIENAYLLGNFDEVDTYVEFLKNKVNDKLELALAYETHIQSYMARQLYQEGIVAMLAALKDFDMELELDPYTDQSNRDLRSCQLYRSLFY